MLCVTARAGELLPRLSILTAYAAVYFCCTFPEVAFGGRYPLSCSLALGLSSGSAGSYPDVTRDRLLLQITNCAVLGAATINAENARSVLDSTIFGAFSGIGFALALLLFASIREKLELAAPPKSFEGTPIALVTAGILAMAFTGFAGLC